MSAEIVLPQSDASSAPPEPRLPRFLCFGGALCVAAAAAVGLVATRLRPESYNPETDFLAFARFTLTLGGLLIGGIAVSLRPNRPVLLAVACLTCLLARAGFHPAWDSGRMVAGFGAIVAAIACVLMALPQTYRRLGVSALVLFHFGCILVAVTSPPTGEYPAPWTTQAATAYVYRPYAQFTFMTASYQYYSPDPGPTQMLWFCISYHDGTRRWFKLPRGPKYKGDLFGLGRHRRLGLAWNSGSYRSSSTIPADILQRRKTRALGVQGIRLHPELSDADQYRPVSESVSLFLLPSYVRHVARMDECRHADGVTPAVSIRVYLVDHHILMPGRMMNIDPVGPNTYMPYFQGEYDANGAPTHTDDDLLGWLIPIFYYKKRDDVPLHHNPKANPNDFILWDGLEVHTGTDRALRRFELVL